MLMVLPVLPNDKFHSSFVIRLLHKQFIEIKVEFRKNIWFILFLFHGPLSDRHRNSDIR